MGLGIGITTAMLSVANALIRKPFAFPHLDRIVLLFQTKSTQTTNPLGLIAADYQEVRRSTHLAEHLAAYQLQAMTLELNGTPERTIAAEVEPEFFTILQITAQQGGLPALSTSQQEELWVVLSHHFWRDHFAGESRVIGSGIYLNKKKYRVLGVMPRQFQFPLGADLWVPLEREKLFSANRSAHDLMVLVGLRPDASPRRFNAEIASLSQVLETTFPGSNRGLQFRTAPLAEFVTGGMTTLYTVYVLCGAMLVLGMACANVACLFLARTTSRRNELCIRIVVGASRWQVVRPLLMESMLVSLIGAILALPLAQIAIHLIHANMPPSVIRFVPGFDAIEIDYVTLFSVLVIAILGGLLAGIFPSLHATSGEPYADLKEGGSSSGGRNAQKLIRWLLVGEIAFSMIVLVGTVTMVRQSQNLARITPDAHPEELVAVELTLLPEQYPDLPSCQRFFDRMGDTLRMLPQVESVALANNIPYGRNSSFRHLIGIDNPLPSQQDTPIVRVQSISPSYFSSLRVRLLQGRGFTDNDTADTMPVALVNIAMAERYWPNSPPLGHRVLLEPSGRWISIVGVVDNVRYDWVESLFTPVLYLPFSQQPSRSSFLLVRSSNPGSLFHPMQSLARQMAPDQPRRDPRTWEQVIAESLIGLSYVAVTLTVIGLVSLALAAAGLYGLLSYKVRMQRREISTRLALGAPPRTIFFFVSNSSFSLVATGILLGLPGCWAASYVLRWLFADIPSWQWGTYVLSVVWLLAVGAMAAAEPALQAMRVSPNEVCREHGGA
jgi:predicted permease